MSYTNQSNYWAFSGYLNLSNFDHYKLINFSSQFPVPYTYYIIEPTAVCNLLGILYLILGTVLICFGKRLIRFTSAIAAFILFQAFTLLIVILANSYDNLTFSSKVIAPIIFGLLSSIIFYFLTKYGIYLLGFLLGANIWSIMFYFAQLSSTIVFIVLCIVFGFITATLTHFKKNESIVISSAFIGSQVFMQGISPLANIGYFVNSSTGYYFNYSTSSFWAMFFGSLLLFVGGALFQYIKFFKVDYIYFTKESEQTDA